MAYPILGTPIPSFFDSSGSPLVSGTVTVTDPDTASAKAVYDSASDANSQTNGVTSAITLNARGEPETELWGRDGEDYTLVIKDSAGSTVQTITDVRLPPALDYTKITNADVISTSTTLVECSYLKNWSLDSNTWYKLTGHLVAVSSAVSQDIKIDFNPTQSLQTSYYSYIFIDSGTAGTVDGGEIVTDITTDVTIDIDGTDEVGVIIQGSFLSNASLSSSIDLRIAQGTDAGTTTLKKGSWITIEPLITTTA